MVLNEPLTFCAPSERDACSAEVDEVVRGGEADGAREVGEDDGRVHLEDDDRVALHRRLDHPHDPPLLLPRRARRQTHRREPRGPLGLTLSGGFGLRIVVHKCHGEQS